MRQSLTTFDKRPAERLEYWQEVVCKKYVAATAATDLDDESFSARLTSRELGPLIVAEMAGPLHYWSRKPAHVRNDGKEVYIVSRIQRGAGELTQFGRIARLGQGDLTIYDCGAPFDYALQASTQLVKIPKLMLEARLGDARALCGRRIERGDPLSALLGDMLETALAIELPDDSGSVVAKRLSGAIVDLVACVYDLRGVSARGDGALEKATAYACAHLDDTTLTPERLAAAAAVSPRTLNRLFGALGATPMRWVWARRLEASRAALAQGQASSVTEAAFAHGFADVAHFSRSFKKAFGVSPQRVLKP